MIGLIDDKVSVYEINKEQFKTTPRNSDEINQKMIKIFIYWPVAGLRLKTRKKE